METEPEYTEFLLLHQRPVGDSMAGMQTRKIPVPEDLPGYLARLGKDHVFTWRIVKEKHEKCRQDSRVDGTEKRTQNYVPI